MNNHEIRLAAVVRDCSDSMLWYAGRIGEVFELYAPYTGGGVNTADGWRVWTNPGINFIRLQDAEITPVRNGERIYQEVLPPAPTPEERWPVRGATNYKHQCCGMTWFSTIEMQECPACKTVNAGKWNG